MFQPHVMTTTSEMLKLVSSIQEFDRPPPDLNHIHDSHFTHGWRCARRSTSIPPPPPPSRHSPTVTPSPPNVQPSKPGTWPLCQASNPFLSSPMDRTKGPGLPPMESMTFTYRSQDHSRDYSFPLPGQSHQSRASDECISICSWTKGDDSTEIGTRSPGRSLCSEADTVIDGDAMISQNYIMCKRLAQQSQSNTSPVSRASTKAAFPPRTSSNFQVVNNESIRFSDAIGPPSGFPSGGGTPSRIQEKGISPRRPGLFADISKEQIPKSPTSPTFDALPLLLASASPPHRYETLPAVLQSNEVSCMDWSEDEDDNNDGLARSSLLPFLSGKRSKGRGGKPFRRSLTGAFRRLSCST